MATLQVRQMHDGEGTQMRRPLVPGWCLMCRKAAMVVWIGPVEHDGQTAPACFCEPCLEAVRGYIGF